MVDSTVLSGIGKGQMLFWKRLQLLAYASGSVLPPIFSLEQLLVVPCSVKDTDNFKNGIRSAIEKQVFLKPEMVRYPSSMGA